MPEGAPKPVEGGTPEPASGKPEGSPDAGTSPAPGAINMDAVFTQPLMGRFKTPKEAEEGLRRSQDEGLRLYNELRTAKESAQKEIESRDQKLQAMQAELEVMRTSTPFRELSKEELEALAKDNPVAAADYIAEKKFRDRDAKNEKARVEQELRDHQTRQRETLAAIEDKDAEMRGNPEAYPKYEEMQPVMNQIADMTKVGKYSPLTGHTWSGEILYLTAMGIASVQAMKAGNGAKTDAAVAAQRKSEADAAASAAGSRGGGSGGSSAANIDPAKKEHEDWKQNVLAHAPKRVFGGGK